MARPRTSGTLLLLFVLLSATGCKHPTSGIEGEDNADLVVPVRTSPFDRPTGRGPGGGAGTVAPSLGAAPQAAAPVPGAAVAGLNGEGAGSGGAGPVLE